MVGRGERRTRWCLVILPLVAALGFAAQSSAAVDLTTVYSQSIVKAVFARHYDTVWNFIDPAYRKDVNKTRWEHCVGNLVSQSQTYRLKSIEVSGTRRLQSDLPVLGRVVLIDVSLQVLYSLPGSHTLQAGILYAYWVKEKGKWNAVWLPSQLSAYKAGKCSPASLY